jgi:RNA polymerase sigma factor (sigma-70 family)
MCSHAGQRVAAGQQGPARAVYKGDEHRFSELARLHQAMAYNCAYRLLGDAEQAAEVTQHALLAARKTKECRRSDTFQLGVLRLVTRACADRLGRRPGPKAEGASAGRSQNLDDWQAAYRERADQERHLQAAILTLPAEERIVLVLADVLGLSYEDIGRVTKLNPSRVSASLGRGRARLRDYLLGTVEGTGAYAPR